MAEEYFSDIVVGFDKYSGIDTRTAAKHVSVEHVCTCRHTLIKVPIKPFTETVKYRVWNHWAMIALIVANRGNCIQTSQLPGSELVRNAMPIKVSEGSKPNVANVIFQLCRQHVFPLTDNMRAKGLQLTLSVSAVSN